MWGLSNTKVVAKRLAQRKAEGFHDLPVVEANQKLASYFRSFVEGVGPSVQLAIRQELNGEMLSTAEGLAKDAAERKVKPPISRREAKRLAVFIAKATRSWPDRLDD